MGFPGGSDGKESACNAGDLGLIPYSERSLGEANGNPLQCFCLENAMDRGAWRAAVYGVEKELDTTKCLTHTSLVVTLFQMAIQASGFSHLVIL